MMSAEQHSSDHLPEKTHKYTNSIVAPDWLEQAVTANGIRQHFYRTGGEKPSLVLLHGFSENGLCWSRVAKALENDYDIIMVDARGHGLSSGPETGYSQELLTTHCSRLSKPPILQRLCSYKLAA